MVIRRAVIIDLARGARLVRVLNVIAAVGSIAPIVGPLFWDALTGHPRWVASVLEFSTGLRSPQPIREACMSDTNEALSQSVFHGRFRRFLATNAAAGAQRSPVSAHCSPGDAPVGRRRPPLACHAV